MGFKENLLKQITINDLVQVVGKTIGAANSGTKMDKKAMKQLLDMSLFDHQSERGMDLYLKPLAAEGAFQILVLDNELSLYETTLADVLLRKNPTLKEMLNVGNAMKILNDKDVVKFRRAESLAFVQQDLLSSLDLTFDRTDLTAIFKEAGVALETHQVDGVIQGILLFCEILGYMPAPLAFQIKGSRVWGKMTTDNLGKSLLGPMVIYAPGANQLVLWPHAIDRLDPQSGTIKALEPPWIKEVDVLAFLRDKALEQGTMADMGSNPV
ncbi:MAG: hypothetical protein QM498_10980 [Desulfobacterium sp.]